MGNDQPVQTNPFQGNCQQLCYLCATATMKVLNQDVCIPIADTSTPATGAITIPKSPTSIIKPSFVQTGSGLHNDPTQPYVDSKQGGSEPVNYASHDQYIPFIWLHMRD